MRNPEEEKGMQELLPYSDPPQARCVYSEVTQPVVTVLPRWGPVSLLGARVSTSCELAALRPAACKRTGRGRGQLLLERNMKKEQVLGPVLRA